MAALSTLAIVGLSAVSSLSKIKQSKEEAKAVVAQGELDASNKAKETQLNAARQQSSFLTSGLTLEGTPIAAIGDIFSTGLEDVNQITTNANTQSKNIVSSARTAALTSLATSVIGASGSGDLFGTLGGSATPESLLSAPIGSPTGFSTTKVG